MKLDKEIKLQELIKAVPNYNNWSIEFTPADEIWTEDDVVWWGDYFIVSCNGMSKQVDSSDIQDALKELVKLANES